MTVELFICIVLSLVFGGFIFAVVIGLLVSSILNYNPVDRPMRRPSRRPGDNSKG